MTHSQIYKVTDNQLVITLPAAFKNKQVRITIDDKISDETDKIALMNMAAHDPLFLTDLQEVNDDFVHRRYSFHHLHL